MRPITLQLADLRMGSVVRKPIIYKQHPVARGHFHEFRP